MDDRILRRALPGEAAAISELAQRSKAYWGYDQAFLERVRDQLTVGPERIRDGHVVVAERDGVLLGFYQLGGEPPDGELLDLFIDPAAIGTGLGRKLWEHAVQAARARGFRSLTLESDPNAELFYVHMGATRIGEREVAPGRLLPVMRIELDDTR
jgi:GNAT superfamily N-acetyltransferase